MKIIHTADLHLGQVIYQNYERSDEHLHFFKQLKQWCMEHHPDALIVSGDVFDIQQPSAATKKAFNDYFVDIHRSCPQMAIVITAGNHDSASRIQADSAIWTLANTTMVGTAPATEPEFGWEEKYIVRIPTGYILAMPYMSSEHTETLQHLLDVVAKENEKGLPVIMMGHTAVAGLDITGHNIEIGKLKTQGTDSFGTGYDYLALGHIHKPQTIDHQDDALNDDVIYPAPVIRYSGSALHVSCDETYPHTVSLVEIDKHGGNVEIKQLRIEELRHFYVLPENESSFESAEDALKSIKEFCEHNQSGYFRLRVDIKTDLPSNFNQMVYDTLATTGDEVRYNPKVIWTGNTALTDSNNEKPTFEVAELQQMENPLDFIEKTIDQYPALSLDEIRNAFKEVEAEIKRMQDEENLKAAAKATKKSSTTKTEGE